MDDAVIAAITAEVADSRKYRGVARVLIAHLAAIELGKGRRHKEAVKEVKNRLHQTVGAYLDGAEMDYAAALARLRAALPDDRKAVCYTMLDHHASSRERLKLLDEFYTTLFGALAPVTSVIDLACGLNPLAIPWMPLMPGARYLAIDVLDDLARFYDDALPLLGVDGRGLSRDVSREGVFDDLGQFDVALVIKALPCLAQIDRTAPARLLQSIPARVLIVSYPVRSLSGESKGMRGHYAESLAQLTADQPWTVERFDFADELAFRITKADRQPA